MSPLTPAQTARRRHVVEYLAHLARDGWDSATHPRWEPLERELRDSMGRPCGAWGCWPL